MTGKDLLIGLGGISHKYYEEAENETISASKPRTLKRSLLIAAVIALTAMLVGCAVVYALRLQDMSIGKETYIQRFDEEGHFIEPTEKERDIITIYGHSGDPIQLALTEWYEFLETYDPNGELSDNIPDHEEISNQYEWTYSCYTLDMAAKVDEIAAKYDLKLLEEWIPFQSWQSDIFFEETGISSFLRSDSGAEISGVSGMYYPPYNFDMDFTLRTDVLDVKLWGTIIYARKDYFPRAFPGGMDLSLFEQWDHTAPDGTKLLLALSSKGTAYIIAEPENAMFIVNLEGNFSGNAYPTADEILTKDQLEQLADLFDYSIKPQGMDRTVVEEKLAQAQAEHDAENAYVPPTYGDFTDALKSTYATPTTSRYTFFDLTGDGEDELLIDMLGYGTIDQWFTMVDGEVQWFWGNDSYLCEGMVLEQYHKDPELDHAQHFYRKSDTETAWMDLDGESIGEYIECVMEVDGQWSYAPEPSSPEKSEITAEEAEAVMAKYKRIDLDWKPVMDYPISETETFADYLEAKDVRVSQEELHQIYQDWLKKLDENGNLHYSHYRILDINGDGVDDLLLKGEDSSYTGITDHYWLAVTYRYGIIEGFANDFYLCEDGIIERISTRHTGEIGVEREGHRFIRLTGIELDITQEIVDFVVYDRSTASWFTDWWGEEPITEEEANEIIAKHPRIDQGMQPISELLD